MRYAFNFGIASQIGGLLLCFALMQGCAKVSLKMPTEPLYVGAYTKVPVQISPTSGLTMEDLDFVIPAGPPGGEISLSRDDTFNAANPDVMLLAGHKPGVYTLQAIEKATNDILAEGDFEVNADWPDQPLGPSLWFAGVLEEPTGVPGAAWGGGPPGQPQNLDTKPALGPRQVDIVLVDTATKRYTTDVAALNAIRDEWMDETVNATESAANFYKEVSFGKFGLTANIYGPVQLPGQWDDYFDKIVHPSGGIDVWKAAGDFYQACATEADSLISFDSGRSLVCVSQSVDDMKFAWPYGGPEVVTTAEGTVSIGGVSMPFNWEEIDGRKVHQTLSHELGHNLGLPDLYNPDVFMFNPPTEPRNLGAWDIMGSSGPLPHFSIAHRMMLGWVEEDWLELFNFQVQTPPVDETVTLHPVEKGAPPSGQKTGVEIRIADGWNYYFEYRKDQSGQIGDQNLPEDNRIFGSDVVSSSYTPPTERPAIVLFDNDPDMDGSVLGNNQNYREVDATDPMYPTDFRVDASGIDGSKGQVQVQYGVVSKPDPYIRPWPAAEDRQWQSPDIEIKNARNESDATWKNVPWAGHTNTIVATVYNGGSLSAPDVEVQFVIKDFNLGFVTITTPLGSSKKDIPALGSAEFEATWTPPAAGHYCVKVEISPYQTPGGVQEISDKNNIAQSNYDKFISATASAPSREVATVEVGNPYDKPTRVFIIPSQTNPYYRTYLEHRWLRLNPGESKKVGIMFEFAPDAAQKGPVDPRPDAQRLPNDVTFVSYIEDPRTYPVDTADLFSGVQVQVLTGRATRIEEFGVDARNTAHGIVLTADNGQIVPGGKVILIIRNGDNRELYREAPVSNGSFAGQLPADWKSVSAYYVPLPGYGDFESAAISR